MHSGVKALSTSFHRPVTLCANNRGLPVYHEIDVNNRRPTFTRYYFNQLLSFVPLRVHPQTAEAVPELLKAVGAFSDRATTHSDVVGSPADQLKTQLRHVGGGRPEVWPTFPPPQ